MRSLPARALVLVLAVALAGCGEPGAQGAPDQSAFKAPAHQPKALAALQAQAGELLNGEDAAFDKRLSELRGHPVVVNKWASWCGPCAAEFPYFAAQAQERAGKVAFLGVDSMDDAEAATAFLETHPVPYPSYSDPDTKISQAMKSGIAWPSTAFYDAEGNFVYAKQGSYANQDLLGNDIERYALGNGS